MTELEKGSEMLVNTLRQQAMVKYVEILKQRDEILSAFIAKYGLAPDEIEQVEERTETGLHWFVRRRETNSAILKVLKGEK